MFVGGMITLRCIANLFLIILLLLIGLPVSAVNLGDKNIILLRAAVDSIWGEYIFSVHNPTDVAQTATVALLLPLEKSDFRANEGATNADLQLNANGDVVLSKDYPVGTTVFSILFKSSASDGVATLSFTAQQPITDLVLMYERSLQLEPQAGDWEQTNIAALPHEDYRTLRNSAPISAGQKFSLRVTNVPTGRQQLHLYAAGFAVILLSLSVLGTAVSMPRVRQTQHTEQNKEV